MCQLWRCLHAFWFRKGGDHKGAHQNKEQDYTLFHHNWFMGHLIFDRAKIETNESPLTRNV